MVCNFVHLYAKGDGSVLRWMGTDDHISNTDVLWFPTHPGSQVTTSYCLVVMSSEKYLNNYPTQPFIQSAAQLRATPYANVKYRRIQSRKHCHYQYCKQHFVMIFFHFINKINNVYL
ncbi:unnamed protein product [Meganyctiphanes norvegica]|uniref:Uncharacterized protein n=1 Tax=Meganyctiphanes norvegica TaxID=48144 RepID=A0AAV2RQ43_MEGNR